MTLPENVESKFRFILVAAKRARQLQAGAKSLVQSQSKKPTRVAQQEVEAGLVPIELIEEVSSGDSNGKGSKARAAK
jgi:DNA-directed RNA polymerase subunit omega